MAISDAEILTVRFFTMCYGWTIILQQKCLKKWISRTCPSRNTMVQLSTPYTDPERHQCTALQTDNRWQYHAKSLLYRVQQCARLKTSNNIASVVQR